MSTVTTKTETTRTRPPAGFGSFVIQTLRGYIMQGGIIGDASFNAQRFPTKEAAERALEAFRRFPGDKPEARVLPCVFTYPNPS